MGIVNRKEAESLASNAYVWLVENASECIRLGNIGMISLLVVLTQYLYGKYYDKGIKRDDGYYIDAKHMLSALNNDYSSIAMYVVFARNKLCHNIGGDKANYYLKIINDNVDLLVEFMISQGIPV